ncbi:hypothetical protein BCR39DRAFT_540138 [Naematelia encephala]|uniref:Uncharacterized protein n=1 Tax=Naematelia encephala TaxID=71784 RepID=A0A1Y2AWA9_9TREE|nr:hypothetical protein BCR39DRAFT_540138 [Naematelia encephala]
MPFTPVHTALGGFLLHLSTSDLLADTGRVFGISGVLDGAIFGGSERWRWSAVAGLVLGPLLARLLGLQTIMPDPGMAAWADQSMGRLGVAGLLVGLGSKLGSGCTSGHFLCGVARLSPRSFVATATFFTTAVLTANLFPAPITASVPAYTLQVPSATTTARLTLGVATLLLANSARRRYFSTLSNPPAMVRLVPFFLEGLTFSLGLLLSGMASPLKVISFLRILPPWAKFDPSLVMVVLTGVLPNALHYARLKSTSSTPDSLKPRYSWESWQVPRRSDIDRPLLLGSALFGVGWGLSGVCPGPAIVALGEIMVSGMTTGITVSASLRGWISFVISLVSGMRLARLLIQVS